MQTGTINLSLLLLSPQPPFSSAPSLSFPPLSVLRRACAAERACYSGNNVLVNRLECGRGLRIPRKRGTLFSHSAQGQEKEEEGSKKRWPFSPPSSLLFFALSLLRRRGRGKGREKKPLSFFSLLKTRRKKEKGRVIGGV